jgi:hypothetical protein
MWKEVVDGTKRKRSIDALTPSVTCMIDSLSEEQQKMWYQGNLSEKKLPKSIVAALNGASADNTYRSYVPLEAIEADPEVGKRILSLAIFKSMEKVKKRWKESAVGKRKWSKVSAPIAVKAYAEAKKEVYDEEARSAKKPRIVDDVEMTDTKPASGEQVNRPLATNDSSDLGDSSGSFENDNQSSSVQPPSLVETNNHHCTATDNYDNSGRLLEKQVLEHSVTSSVAINPLDRSPSKRSRGPEEFYCAVYLWNFPSLLPVRLGLIALPSRRSSTFDAARSVIEQAFENDKDFSTKEWNFFLPGKNRAVPVDEEADVGPVVRFFETCPDCQIGSGALDDPVNLLLRLK